MRPGAGQAGEAILILRKFNLKRSFASTSVLGKNVENQRGAIQYFYLFTEAIFKSTLMAGRKLIVEDDDLRFTCQEHLFDFIDFAGADKRSRIDMGDVLLSLPDNIHTGCICQQSKFFQ